MQLPWFISSGPYLKQLIDRSHLSHKHVSNLCLYLSFNYEHKSSDKNIEINTLSTYSPSSLQANELIVYCAHINTLPPWLINKHTLAQSKTDLRLPATRAVYAMRALPQMLWSTTAGQPKLWPHKLWQLRNGNFPMSSCPHFFIFMSLSGRRVKGEGEESRELRS